MIVADFVQSPLALPVSQLGRLFPAHDKVPPNPSAKSLGDWRMEDDDGPIFRYLYHAHQPLRHLEFGTWQGHGTCLCLEECAATVWTINLAEGESKSDGTWAYGQPWDEGNEGPAWAETKVFGTNETGPILHCRTDAQGFIGRFYRARGLGHRVCQIYGDSREWDHSIYPRDFFDSVLVDGGHQPEVVINDTRKALALLRPGGLILWHDFCPLPEIRTRFESARGVTSAIESLLPEIAPQLAALHWINPSWILLGIKK